MAWARAAAVASPGAGQGQAAALVGGGGAVIWLAGGRDDARSMPAFHVKRIRGRLLF
jgi:hypothetical protein